MLASLIAATSYTLLILRWHGKTNVWESLYIAPGGFGSAIATSSVFVALTVGVDNSHMAVATSGLYLSGNIGAVSGMSVVSAVLQSTLRVSLAKNIKNIDGKDEIIERALSDIEYVRGLKGQVKDIVVRSYVQSLWYTHFVSLTFSLLAFLTALCSREHKF